MKDMRTWKAILLASMAGVIASAYFLWPALLSKSELLLSLREKWPEISLIWLFTYGFLIVVLCVVHILRTCRRRSRWVQAYVLELAKAQYWTAALMLLALDLSHLPLGVDSPLPPIMPVHPALTSFGALILIGVIGFLITGIGLTLSERQQTPYLSGNLEGSFREILTLLRAQTSAAAVQSSSAEMWQGSMYEALNALALETSRLRDELHTAIEELRASRMAEPIPQAEPTEFATLREAAFSIEQSVPKLEQAINSLSTVALSTNQYTTTIASADAISDISGQLDELLRDVSEHGQMHA
jgi:hypothetical protein